MPFLRIADPRYFQILTLSSLLIIAFVFTASPNSVLVCVITLVACLITQAIACRIINIPIDIRSPLITGLSLTILLKSSIIFLIPLAGVLAIASKFIIRRNDAHIFNPANFGIVALLIAAPSYIWISPAQWGSGVILGAFLTCMAILVLFKLKSRVVSLAFIAFWAAMIFGRAAWLGDPLSIPMHQMQSGALLIFTFFMISDPKTTPHSARGQTIFAFFIAIAAFILQTEFHIREAVFYALFGVCLARYALNKGTKPCAAHS